MAGRQQHFDSNDDHDGKRTTPQRRASSKHWLADLRRDHGLSQEALAVLLSVDPGTVARWERGAHEIRNRNLARLADALDTPVAVLHRYAAGEPLPRIRVAQRDERATPAQTGQLPVSRLVLPPAPVLTEFTDAGQLEVVHGYISSLVSLDNRFGGTELVAMATRFFGVLHDQIGSGAHDPAIGTDLYAAAGELAEVVGWLAYDAQQHDLVRRMNQESLYFTRLAGDRSMELLTLQNASMHAGAVGRPAEALTLARSVLESDRHLTPRLRALFLVRKARALAQAGDASALRTLEEAKSLFLTGTSATDPAWAWWVNEREIAWHEAMAKRDLGLPGQALEEFEHSVEAATATEIRSSYTQRAYLLQAQVDVGAWADADDSATQLLPLIGQIRSNRTVKLLDDALSDAIAASPDHEPSDALRRLSSALETAR